MLRAFTLLFWLALVGAAFASDPPAVPSAPENSPRALDSGQAQQTIRFKSVFASPTNDKIGVWQRGLLCTGPEELRFTRAMANTVLRDFGVVVRRELDAAGYPKIVESAFRSSLPSEAADYELGATLVGLQLNACGTYTDFDGGLWIQVKWELFAPRERRVVYTALTEGTVRAANRQKTTLGEFARGAIANAARNLLAETAFVEQATRSAPFASATVAELPRLLIARRGVTSGRTQDLMPQLRSAVVTVYSGATSGSGFYIDPDGYLLTNQHVVGDSKFVKIKLASGRELLGEVLRSAAVRDVALVKTEPVALAPFELAQQEPSVGTEVYALGSPLGDANSSSVTRGVLSAIREVDRQRWLQSDVRVLPGSSGGPLIGGDGAVVGLTARAVASGLAGINYFVPIREALETLRVGFKGE